MSKSDRLQDFFLNQVEVTLSYVDFDKLQESYSTDMEYAKSLLHSLNDTFERVYKTDCINEDMGLEFVSLPAVIVGRNTGELCVGIVTLDTESSGEHWGTTFLTKYGSIVQGVCPNKETADYIRERFVPYDYFYTPKYDGDIHVDPKDMPDKVATLMPQGDDQSMQMQ